MAKIAFEMDTVEKTYTLTIDGKPVDNVVSLSAYMDYPYANDSDGDEDDKCSVSINTVERNEEEGMRHYTQISASAKGVETSQKEISDKPVVNHIADFLSSFKQQKRR